ncbi:hypothetical protein HYW17_02305 [Candidatus Uhrbacteria bacterium]|nr:hypothetical protein [Candidatus Uhrbacteria bacterium]
MAEQRRLRSMYTDLLERIQLTKARLSGKRQALKDDPQALREIDDQLAAAQDIEKRVEDNLKQLGSDSLYGESDLRPN